MAKKNEAKLKFDLSERESQALYEKLKAEFSLDDLKAFDVEEKDTLPLSTVIAEFETMIRQKHKENPAETGM